MAGPHWIGSLDMDQQHWGAIFTPDERWDDAIGSWNAITTLGAGITMTSVVAIYLLLSIRRAIGLEILTARLRRTTVELRREAEKVNHLACHDALTGLSNRLSFRNEAERELRRARRGEFALLYLDLDRFKDVNDTLGHPVGDALLREVARRLQAESAKSIRSHDWVATSLPWSVGSQAAPRRAGARNAVHRGARPAIHDRRTQCRNRRFDRHRPGRRDRDCDGADTLMRNADLAMYRAKQDGRGKLRFFDPDMDAQAQARHKLEMDLRQALDQGQFELYYQPLVSLQDRRISGFEALLRWHHPTRGLVPPAEFIPLAEEIGLIVPDR